MEGNKKEKTVFLNNLIIAVVSLSHWSGLEAPSRIC